MNMLGGRGKGRIRAPRRGLTGKDESSDFEATWQILSSALLEIHTKNASKLSFEELYRNAYKLVLRKKGEELYNRVKRLEEDWLSNEIRTRIHNSISPKLLKMGAGPQSVASAATANERLEAGERFLRHLREAWKDHELTMSMITDVMMYMDRVYSNDHHRPSIYNAAMSLFRDYVLRSGIDGEPGITVGVILRNVMLDLIQLERAGQVIDRSAIQSCVAMLESLYEADHEADNVRLYANFFEAEFLRSSQDFYYREGEDNVRSMDAGSFAKHAWKRLREETDRCESTLSKTTEPKIQKVVEEELISKHLKAVIELEGSGVKAMLDNNRTQELEVIYELNSRVDKEKKELSKAVQKRLGELGSDINRSAANFKPQEQPENTKAAGKQPEKPINQQTAAAITWVEDILKLKRQYDAIWVQSFSRDQGLQTAMSRSFAEFINACDRSQEYLSLFFDENLRKGIKGKSDTEVDALLEDGITLLRFIRDKDLFETYYKKHLSRRLITKRSVSMDAERQMISKMKIEVGNAFTSKLEQMFKDVAVSEDLTAGFKEYVANLGDRDPSRIELEISVLTSTMWPMENMTQTKPDGTELPVCRYPAAVDRVKQGFEKFYHNKHNGRQLTWLPHMGGANIRAIFPKNPHKQTRRELECSTFAMFVLLLFNDLPDDESLTFEDIQSSTNILTNELTRTLAALSLNPKTKILIKEPHGKEILPTDRFSFNAAFDSKFVRVKIGVIAGAANRVEGVKERHETEKKQEDDRKHAMEAAIVRIMKQRKTLSHPQLISEVIQQLAGRFAPEIPFIKQRVESLIEREYLERAEDSNSNVPTYVYLA